MSIITRKYNDASTFLMILFLLISNNVKVSSFSFMSTSNTNKQKINCLISPYYKFKNDRHISIVSKLYESSTNSDKPKIDDTEEENAEESESAQYIPFEQTYNFNIPPILRPKIPPMKNIHNEISQLSPLTLAYIGDVVYELFIRSRYIYPPKRNMSETQHVVVNNVRAETQSRVYEIFKSKFILSPEEIRIMSRGRNASSKSGPKRFKSLQKNGKNDAGTYQDATAFEALIGYLYIKDIDRCYVVLNCISSILDDMDS